MKEVKIHLFGINIQPLGSEAVLSLNLDEVQLPEDPASIGYHWQSWEGQLSKVWRNTGSPS